MGDSKTIFETYINYMYHGSHHGGINFKLKHQDKKQNLKYLILTPKQNQKQT